MEEVKPDVSAPQTISLRQERWGNVKEKATPVPEKGWEALSYCERGILRGAHGTGHCLLLAIRRGRAVKVQLAEVCAMAAFPHV